MNVMDVLSRAYAQENALVMHNTKQVNIWQSMTASAFFYVPSQKLILHYLNKKGQAQHADSI